MLLSFFILLVEVFEFIDVKWLDVEGFIVNFCVRILWEDMLVSLVLFFPWCVRMRGVNYTVVFELRGLPDVLLT